MDRVMILYADSWGLLGNANAARGLERRLRGISSDATVELVSGEQVWPQFAEWGQRITALSRLSDPGAVSNAYAEITTEISETVKLWPEQQPLQAPSRVLARMLPNSESTIIATKGLLARLALAAGVGKVTNWITNPGLIDLRFHVCLGAHLTCVPRSEDASRLIALGHPPERLRVTGPTVELPFSLPDHSGEAPSNPTQSPLIVLYAPAARIGPVRALLRDLSVIGTAKVVLVTHAGDGQEWEAAFPDAVVAPLSLRVCRGLSHAEFLALLQQLREAPDRILITKSGPNSIFEVIDLGLPLVVYCSGLPMEEWVRGYVADHRVGVVAADWSELVPRVSAVIGNFAAQREMIAAQKQLRATLFADRSAPNTALAEAISPECDQ